MSLRAIFDKEKTQSIKAIMPDELIVYKVVRISHTQDWFLMDSIRAVQDRCHKTKRAIPYSLSKMIEDLNATFTRYVSLVCDVEYFAGEQTNRWDLGRFDVPVADKPGESSSYYPGFHSFAQKAAGEKYFQAHPLGSSVVLTCGVLKDWITAIGIEGDRNMIIVSNRILIPAYPHTDIRNDKNCEWFFKAQSKADSTDENLKTGVAQIQPLEIQPICRQKRKHR